MELESFLIVWSVLTSCWCYHHNSYHFSEMSRGNLFLLNIAIMLINHAGTSDLAKMTNVLYCLNVWHLYLNRGRWELEIGINTDAREMNAPTSFWGNNQLKHLDRYTSMMSRNVQSIKFYSQSKLNDWFSLIIHTYYSGLL